VRGTARRDERAAATRNRRADGFADSPTFVTAVVEPKRVTRRLFGTLCGLVFLVNFGRTAFAPLVGTFQSVFGVGPATVGVVTTLVWLGTAVPRIPVGYLLTRVPRHYVVFATGVLLSAAAAYTSTATSVRTLQIGAFAIGVASGAYFAAAIPLVGELYPDAVGRSLGIHGTAAQLAAVAAAPATVFLLSVASWRAVFWALSGGAALATAALILAVWGTDATVGTGADRDFVGALSHWRLVLAGMAIIATAGFVWQGLFNFFVSYLVAEKAFSQAAAGTMLTVVFAAGVPAFWLSGRLADRLPRIPYILGMLSVYVLCLFALTAVRSFAAVFVVTALLGYAIHSLFPALDAWILAALPDDVRGSVYAVFSGASLLVEANGSGAVGALTGAGYSFDAVFRLFGAGLVVVVVALAALYLLGRFPGASPSPRSDPART
jgi:predicted MFS family arabinose efflux permease